MRQLFGGLGLNIVQVFLGIGMVVSGLVLARHGLRNTSIGRGVLQLIAGIVLLAGGAYAMITAMM